MAEKLLKNEYETPRAQVRGVFLEGAIADSVYPRVPSGSIQYEPYDAPEEDEQSILLF
jgi:hypothetical protein